jgi:hypothetical protein
MKKYFYLFGISFLTFVSCNEAETSENMSNDLDKEQVETVSYAYFGDTITEDGAISGEEMLAKYKAMQAGDTLEVKFAGVIQNVCQKKGCWMNVALTEDENTFVRFKDYGFFMPFNAQESNVIVNGKAFISVVSVDELKHYAEDDGQSQEEIDAITEPEITYSFTADGVLIEE